METLRKVQKKSLLNRFLSAIEIAGNRMPEPSTMFIILALIVIVISGICSAFDVSAIHPGTGEVVKIDNLLSVDGIRKMWSGAVTNFSGFAPFGMVMVAVIGSGVAEKTSFLAILMRKTLGKAPSVVVTFTIIFMSFFMHIAGDAGFIIMPPLAAIVFMSQGRHPLLGMFVAFAAVAGGLCANFIIGLSDVLAFSFTLPAAKLIDPNYLASPAINYYFLLLSSFLLAIGGTLITEKVLAPRFDGKDISKYKTEETIEITDADNKGLRAAGYATIISLIVLGIMCMGDKPILGDPKTGSLLAASSSFMSGIIVTATLFLLIPSAAFGFASGRLKNDKDLYACIIEAFKDMAPYILLCFFCAQFTSYFNWSNLGAILAIKGASALTAMNITGLVLLIGVVILSCIINIFIGSASAKWAILAPVFIPMLMLMGFDPAVTQMAYRIGDSITNPISPLFSYFPLILGFARRYEPATGMGTIISNMIPYSVTFALIWIIQLTIWVLLDLPLGPGGPIKYLPY